MSLHRDMATVLNKHSIDTRTDTPDWVLADYLVRCLRAFTDAVDEREAHEGTPLSTLTTRPRVQCRDHSLVDCRSCRFRQCLSTSSGVQCVLFHDHPPIDSTHEHNHGGLSPDSVWKQETP